MEYSLELKIVYGPEKSPEIEKVLDALTELGFELQQE